MDKRFDRLERRVRRAVQNTAGECLRGVYVANEHGTVYVTVNLANPPLGMRRQLYKLESEFGCYAKINEFRDV